MTYEEAKQVLHSGLFAHDDVRINHALNLAIEAIEKQIPKKANDIHHLGEIDKYVYGNCPECGCCCNYEMQYCDFCGQALKWSDTAAVYIPVERRGGE